MGEGWALCAFPLQKRAFPSFTNRCRRLLGGQVASGRLAEVIVKAFQGRGLDDEVVSATSAGPGFRSQTWPWFVIFLLNILKGSYDMLLLTILSYESHKQCWPDTHLALPQTKEPPSKQSSCFSKHQNTTLPENPPDAHLSITHFLILSHFKIKHASFSQVAHPN